MLICDFDSSRLSIETLVTSLFGKRFSLTILPCFDDRFTIVTYSFRIRSSSDFSQYSFASFTSSPGFRSLCSLMSNCNVEVEYSHVPTPSVPYAEISFKFVGA